jgi:glc operon protein GlcG
MSSYRTAAIAASLLAAALPAAAQTADKRTLTMEGARRAIQGAVAYAHSQKTTGVIAVVDDGGNLMAVERIDGTFPAGAMISIGKARTAAMFKKPTAFFEEVIGKGRTSMVALADFTPLQGGVPIVIDGQVVGAVGVSGAASAKQDDELALAAAGALVDAASGPVTYIGADKVKAAFVKGQQLVETDDYKVHASHRDGAGMAEVHVSDTDIIYMLSGGATFVTGGKVIDGKTIADGEIRGARIDGGDTRRLAPGDVIIVPKGLPHWFKDTTGALNYYVVKVH